MDFFLFLPIFTFCTKNQTDCSHSVLVQFPTANTNSPWDCFKKTFCPLAGMIHDMSLLIICNSYFAIRSESLKRWRDYHLGLVTILSVWNEPFINGQTGGKWRKSRKSNKECEDDLKKRSRDLSTHVLVLSGQRTLQKVPSWHHRMVLHIVNTNKHTINTTIAIEGKLQTHINVKNIIAEDCERNDWGNVEYIKKIKLFKVRKYEAKENWDHS